MGVRASSYEGDTIQPRIVTESQHWSAVITLIFTAEDREAERSRVTCRRDSA